jgi:hypothetical protein
MPKIGSILMIFTFDFLINYYNGYGCNNDVEKFIKNVYFPYLEWSNGVF